MTFDIYAISAELKTLMNNEFPEGYPAKDFIIEEETKISGKSAGMCYCNDDFNKILDNNDGAKTRFRRVVSTHHHSIAEHAHIEVVITGISKVLAMVLNNQQCYATSEKSGRYTQMTGNTEAEKKAYDKWYKILFDELMKNDTIIAQKDAGEKTADKLAKENARYLLGIFSPIVSMCYTCSLMQWTYLAQWMREAIEDMKKDITTSHQSYIKNLSREFQEFSECIENSGLYIPELVNRKHRKIDTFIGTSHIYNEAGDYPSRYGIDVDTTDEVIVARFQTSFAALAQLQRHRTTKFYMSVCSEIGTISETRFHNDERYSFIPEIVPHTMKMDWLHDRTEIISASDDIVLLIGDKIACKMITTFDNFKSIMMERCCGRAQFETMAVVNRIHEAVFRSSELYREFCADYKLPQRGVTKCMMQKCVEPCMFIKNGLDKRTF